jgi:hypothetical protein
VSKLEVDVDVPSWVDDGGLATFGEQIRVVRKAFRSNPLEEHRLILGKEGES